MMQASQEIKEFIKSCEGLKLNTYRCPSGVLTIGYGHTGPDVKPGGHITPEIANRLFEEDMPRFERELNAAMQNDGVKRLAQHQFDALLSFAYNVGMAKLKGSTLWRKVKANPDDDTIPSEFARWVYGTSNGKKVQLPGLIKRRAREARWYAGI